MHGYPAPPPKNPPEPYGIGHAAVMGSAWKGTRNAGPRDRGRRERARHLRAAGTDHRATTPAQRRPARLVRRPRRPRHPPPPPRPPGRGRERGGGGPGAAFGGTEVRGAGAAVDGPQRAAPGVPGTHEPADRTVRRALRGGRPLPPGGAGRRGARHRRGPVPRAALPPRLRDRRDALGLVLGRPRLPRCHGHQLPRPGPRPEPRALHGGLRCDGPGPARGGAAAGRSLNGAG